MVRFGRVKMANQVLLPRAQVQVHEGWPKPRHGFTGNRILDNLTRQEFDHLYPYLQPISFSAKHVLYQPGDRITFVYFPVTTVFTVVTRLTSGSSVEIGTLGNEGFFGLSSLLGDGVAIREVAVLAAGAGFRINADFVRHELGLLPTLVGLILQLSAFVIDEISQTAACNGRHALEARLARWLLTMRDKLQTADFQISQETLAELLGAQRTAITAAATKLREKGLIRYRHARVTIVESAGLESLACECYEVMRDMRDHFLRG